MQDLGGRKLGKYELRERLGRGGMAEVYKAYQPGMDRFVAIKVMLAHLANDDGFVERFRREAQAVGKLRHPHIVQIFDFGDEGDIYFMAMEYIQGGNLKAHIIQQQRLDAETSLRIASQLADALDYAHRAGMIHRDLKPANVMFVDREHQHAVLTDFGIARILGQSGLTGTGMAVGTPSYMSPEAGRGENVDERSDLYALGIILYEMLTGTVPYDADTPLAVIMKHINAPLPTRREYGDFIPPAAEKVMLRCLAKDPEDRYATAGELKQALDLALEELQHTSPTEASPAVAGTGVGAGTAKVDMPTILAQPDQPTTIQQPIAPAAAPSGKFPVGIAAVVALVVIGALIALFALTNNQGTPEPTAIAQVTEEPSVEPTAEPTLEPTAEPTLEPTAEPTLEPTAEPTLEPTAEPTEAPTNTPEPSTNTPEPPTNTPEPPTNTPEPPTPVPPSPVPVQAVQPPYAENLQLISGLYPFLDSADRQLLQGDPNAAFAIVDNAVQQNPQDFHARFSRAMLAASIGRSTLARNDATWVYTQDPNNPLATIALWHALMSGDNPRVVTAGRLLDEAEEKFPDNPDIPWMRARHELLTGGDLNRALVAFNRAEEGGVGGWRFIATAGQVLFAAGEYQRALPYLEIMRDQFAFRPELSQMAETMLAEITGSTPPAPQQVLSIPEMRFVPPPHPDNLSLLTGISPLVDEVDQMILSQGRDAALAWINGLLEAEPDNIGALYARSELISLGYDEELQSRHDAERLIELAPDSPLGYIALSDSWLAYPDYNPEQAIAAIRQAQALDPNHPQVLWRAASATEWDQRMEAFNRAENAGARGWRFARFAGWNLYEQWQWERALPYLLNIYDSGTGSDYDRSETRTFLMGALIQTGQAQLAFPIAEQAVAAEPYAEVFADAAYVAFRADQRQQARVWARNAIALSNEVPQANYVLALLAWYADRDLEAAIDGLNRLEGVDVYSAFINDNFRHDLDLDRARIYMQAGEPEVALGYYDSMIERYCCENWLFEERAGVHLALDQREAAIADLRSAYEMTQDPEYRQALLNRLTELSGN